MLIKGAQNQSQIALCLEAAGLFLLKRSDAKQRVIDLMTGLADRWKNVCEASGLTPVDRNELATRQVFNPFIFENLEEADQDILALANGLRARLPATLQ